MTTNATLTPDIIADKMLDFLDNDLVFGKLVSRDYEPEFSGTPKPGETIRIRRPSEYTVRTGKTADFQDSIEGSTTMTILPQIGVDLKFSSRELTLNIEKFAERHLMQPAIALANTIETSLAGLYTKVNNWAGTPGQLINSFTDFAVGPTLMDNLAMGKKRMGVLSPDDAWALQGAFSSLYINGVANDALTKAKLPPIGDVDVYRTQVVATHTVGAHGGTPLTRGASQQVTYSSVKTTMTQTLSTDGWTTNSVLRAGDVFTIADVYDVNPITKVALPRLKQFTIVENVTTNTTSSNETAITIYPAMILVGPHQNVSAANGNDKTITMVGTASANYRQNMLFTKEAFALVTVPMDLPTAAAKATRRNYKGISMRLTQGYDIVNDDEVWRFDILYGVAAVDPRQAIRLSGT